MREARVLLLTGGDEGALCEALSAVRGVEALPQRDRADVVAAMSDADALVTSTAIWDADLSEALARSSRLRWVQLVNAGFDNMERLGVPRDVVVSTIGSVGAELVAEHAVALLLALLRNIPAAIRAQTHRQWAFGEVSQAMASLRRRRVAVIGFGHIGRASAQLLKAHGASVTAFARTRRIAVDGTSVEPLRELRAALPKCDAIVIAIPLNSETERLMNEAVFASAKRGVLLVNVARGRIVDTGALIDALADGRVGGAALDVTDPEPLPRHHGLWSFPNVIITPHVAWAGGDSSWKRDVLQAVVRNVRRFVRGEQVRDIARLERN